MSDTKTKTVKDAVHDHIQVEDVALDLLDTPEMQRLRHIRQLGTAYLVYPSANHTRFEHSLGVYHLAKKAMKSLGVDGRDAEAISAASLLHDVGHTPFSHTVEDVVEEYTGKRHDEVDGILEGNISEVLENHDLDPHRIARLIRGEGRLGQIVSGKLDVDRMDYLVRDAHHTGVPYGTIDSTRLILELELHDGDLVLGEGNVQTAEALLIARSLMHPTVYSHHVARISKAMLKRATRRLVETTDLTGDDVRRMDDHQLVVSLRQSPETADLGRRIVERRLYKRAVWEPYQRLPNSVEDGASVRDFEDEIGSEAGVDPRRIILDVSPPPEIDETSASVLVDGDKKTIDEASRLVGDLRASLVDQWKYGVYCPQEDIEDVASAFESLCV
ncbi:MAG: HD domain-containing protein [Halobacteria archaeon]|nr:HD domain-containing protein [Halobacteria archaeon]